MIIEIAPAAPEPSFPATVGTDPARLTGLVAVRRSKTWSALLAVS
jgi:hypothetical protein